MQSTLRKRPAPDAAAASSSTLAATAMPAAAASGKQRRVGAISEAHATSEDLRSTAVLEAALLSRGAGDPALARSRDAACAQMQALLAGWVRTVGVAHGLSEQQASDAGSGLLTLGSCALGVPGAGADIDLVAVVPYFVERAVFFSTKTGFVSVLATADGVDTESMHPVPDAFVPVVKFGWRGVPVDLLLARLKIPQLPRELTALTPGLLTRCFEDKDVHSLNGARVAADILRRVPHVERYQTTLRAVKLWAQRRGLNQHASGFPGGVAWALLTARVCQLHPNATPSTLLHKFFMTWHVWRFGEDAVPVLLDEAAGDADADAEEAPPTHLKIADWSRRDRGYLMPVITPCRPRLCSTHSVTKSTLGVIKAEIARAHELASVAMLARPVPSPAAAVAAAVAPSDPAVVVKSETPITASTPATAPTGRGTPVEAADERWGALFAPIDFFDAYEHYVGVQLTAASAAELLHWRSFVKVAWMVADGLLMGLSIAVS